MIKDFIGEYLFLSNFYTPKNPIMHDGKAYPTVEHAFQAAKTRDPEQKEKIRLVENPGEAKRLGRQVILRPDWEDVKIAYMTVFVYDKFFNNPDLAARLVATAPQELIEGNHWHDNYWGDCYCYRCKDIEGQNHLGKILMRLRSKLMEGDRNGMEVQGQEVIKPVHALSLNRDKSRLRRSF